MNKKVAHGLPFVTGAKKEASIRTKPRKRANELDGKTWLQYSISVWNDIRKSKEELELRHP